MTHPGSDDTFIPLGAGEPTHPAFRPAMPPATAPVDSVPAAAVPVPPPPASFLGGTAAVPSSAPTGSAPGYPSPYSAAPYPQQYSAPPVSAPYGYGPLVPERKRGRAGIIVLSILCALFLVTTGVFATLFVTRTADANRMSDQVTQLSGERTDLTTKSNSLQRDLDAAKRDLADAQSKNDETSRQRTVLADCLNAIIDETKAINAAKGVITADVKAKEAVTEQKCDAASRLL